MQSVLIVCGSSQTREQLHDVAREPIRHKQTLGEVLMHALGNVGKDSVLSQGYTKDASYTVKCVNTNSLTTMFMTHNWNSVHYILGDSLLTYIISTYYVIPQSEVRTR